MKQPPKILLGVIDLSTVTGGIAVLSRLVFRSFQELHRKGHIRLEVQVLNEKAPCDGDQLLKDCQGIPIRWCAGSKVRFVTGILLSRPDMIFFDIAGPARAARLIPEFIRPRYCTFICGVEVVEQVRDDYLKALRGAELLIAISNYTASRALALHSNLPPVKVCLLGLDNSDRGRPHSVSSMESIGPQAMLIVGRLSSQQRHKGHDQLIECMPRILARTPDAQLVVAGGGDDLERLRLKAETYGVARQVLFLGRVSDEVLYSLYQNVALFVMPSTGDGFGFVFLEAMSHKLPCVGLKEGSAAEIIEHGTTGILVDKDNLDDMANALAGLLEHAELRSNMGAAGFERLNSMFLYPHFNERFRKIVEGLIVL